VEHRKSVPRRVGEFPGTDLDKKDKTDCNSFVTVTQIIRISDIISIYSIDKKYCNRVTVNLYI